MFWELMLIIALGKGGGAEVFCKVESGEMWEAWWSVQITLITVKPLDIYLLERVAAYIVYISY